MENINNTMKEVQLFFAEQLNGKTIQLKPAAQVNGEHDLKFYCPRSISETQCIKPEKAGDNPWEEIDIIVRDIEKQDPTFRKGRVNVIFLAGGYSISKGYKYSQDYGVVLVGDWALRPPEGKDAESCRSLYVLTFCTNPGQSVAHETGHATAGLEHSKNDGTNKGDKNYWELSIMHACEWPKCIFLDSPANPEKQKLLASPFIK
jgi:hypothetical protein